MHRRREARDAVVAVLAAIPSLNGNVFPFRSRVLGEDEVPGCRVFTPRDSRDGGSSVLRGQDFHRIEVRIELLVKATEQVENEVDDLCEEIEAAFAADPMLGGMVSWLVYQSTEIDFEDEEDRSVMQATLVFEAEYGSQ